MDDIAIKPTNVTAVANYLLSLDQPAVEKNYQSNWQYSKQRLKEVLEVYTNPGRIIGETLINHFDRTLGHLFDSTRLLTEQLTTDMKQQLQMYLQISGQPL